MNKSFNQSRMLQLAAILIFALSGCASAPKVPTVNSADLPPVYFRALSPRSLRIEVKNTRLIDEKTKDTAAVEKSVFDAMSDAATRGGLKIDSKSRNSLAVLIQDYDGNNPLGQQKGECVKISGVLQAKWGSALMAEGFACHQLKHWIGINLGGDVSEAYTYAIKLILQELENKQMDLLRGGRAM